MHRILIIGLILISGCAKNFSFNDDGDISGTEFPSIGSDPSLEIVTWNIEHFPKSYHTTIEYATRIIREIDVDIIALQEIESSGYFQILLDELECKTLELDKYGDCPDTLGWGNTISGCTLLTGCSTVNEYDIEDAEWLFTDSLACIDQCSIEWEGFRANSASYSINLAYIYNASIIQPVDIYEIYEDDWWSFPRSPLVFEFYWNDQNFVLINNHLKCCSGTENEARRESASFLLELYIETYFPNEQVIVVGDWNDEIETNNTNQPFWNFISNSVNYQFTDMEIAEGNSYYWSYPTWPSHIDHILITDELFDTFNNGNSTVQTYLIDEYLEGGWSEYDAILSDHRPVALKLQFNGE